MVKALVQRTAVFLEAIKFSHSVFALPFAMFATVLADAGWPGWDKLGLAGACMVCVRTVAMAYNRLADQKLDSRNPRTRDRALPAGRLTRSDMWTLLLAGVFGASGACFGFGYLFGNWYPAALLVPLLLYVCAYSHAKRFTWLCHYWLGSVLGLSVPAGFLAVDPRTVSAGTLLVALAVCLWTAGFDIIYSLGDLDRDRAEGLYSIPARFGVRAGLWVSRITHLCAFACLVLAGPYFALGSFYAVGLAGVGGLLVLEHSLVRPDDFSRISTAFFTVNGILSIFLSGMGVIDVLW